MFVISNVGVFQNNISKHIMYVPNGQEVKQWIGISNLAGHMFKLSPWQDIKSQSLSFDIKRGCELLTEV